MSTWNFPNISTKKQSHTHHTYVLFPTHKPPQHSHAQRWLYTCSAADNNQLLSQPLSPRASLGASRRVILFRCQRGLFCLSYNSRKVEDSDIETSSKISWRMGETGDDIYVSFGVAVAGHGCGGLFVVGEIGGCDVVCSTLSWRDSCFKSRFVKVHN